MEAISGKSSKSSGIPEREAIQYRQKRFAILYNKALATGEVKNFDQLKYRQVIYQPGDYLQVYNYDDEDSPFVCKLNRIIALPESKGELPFILVDWCLRKRDLPSKVTGKYL